MSQILRKIVVVQPRWKRKAERSWKYYTPSHEIILYRKIEERGGEIMKKCRQFLRLILFLYILFSVLPLESHLRVFKNLRAIRHIQEKLLKGSIVSPAFSYAHGGNFFFPLLFY